MLYYEGDDVSIDVTIGKDAAYYHEQAAHLHWDEDIQLRLCRGRFPC